MFNDFHSDHKKIEIEDVLKSGFYSRGNIIVWSVEIQTKEGTKVISFRGNEKCDFHSVLHKLENVNFDPVSEYEPSSILIKPLFNDLAR